MRTKKCLLFVLTLIRRRRRTVNEVQDRTSTVTGVNV